RRRPLPFAVGGHGAGEGRHAVRLPGAHAGLPRARARSVEGGRMMPTVRAEPYAWPYDGHLTPRNTALVIIDMQTDFCGAGGYVDAMGYDLALPGPRAGPM